MTQKHQIKRNLIDSYRELIHVSNQHLTAILTQNEDDKNRLRSKIDDLNLRIEMLENDLAEIELLERILK